LKRELDAAQHEAKRAEDAVKIKVLYTLAMLWDQEPSLGLIMQTKLVDDNAASIRSLRQGLAEKERELQRLKEEGQRRDGDLKDRLQAEKEISQQMQADLEVCSTCRARRHGTERACCRHAMTAGRSSNQPSPISLTRLKRCGVRTNSFG